MANVDHDGDVIMGEDPIDGLVQTLFSTSRRPHQNVNSSAGQHTNSAHLGSQWPPPKQPTFAEVLDPELDKADAPYSNEPVHGPDEPQAEHLITFSGNVTNYYMEGYGQKSVDRDLAAAVNNSEQPNPEVTKRRLIQACDTRLCSTEPPQRLNSLTTTAHLSTLVSARTNSGNDSSPYGRLPGADYIRLLLLLPGHGSAEVQCAFHVVSLEEANDGYEALSYTWESRSTVAYNPDGTAKDIAVRCNGLMVFIKPNLYNGLVMLRRSDRSRLLWADALCINQQDMEERASQVALMGQIFQSAHRVIIWLGIERVQTTHRAFHSVCALVNSWLTRKDVPAKARFATLPSQVVETSSSTDFHTDSDAWLDIFGLYGNRYWSRVWVIQEALLARSAQVIWGDSVISWELIGIAASIVRTNYSRIHQAMRSYFDNSVRRTVPTGIINAYFMYRNSSSQRYSDRLEYSFHTLLSLTRQFDCLDMRDRIYGLLGLRTTDGANQHIVPDYKKSTTQLYSEVARQIILKSKSLNILSSVQKLRPVDGLHQYQSPHVKQYDHTGPSWVPQWHLTFSRSLAPLTAEASFSASDRLPADLREDRDEGLLVVKGMIVGTASHISWPSFDHFWRGVQPDTLWDTPAPPNDTEGTPIRSAHLGSVLQNNEWTLAEFQKLAITMCGGKNWYGLPIADVQAHMADFAMCLLKDGLTWALRKPRNGNQGAASFYQYRQDEHNMKSPRNQPTVIVDLNTLQNLAANGGNADRFLDAATTTCERRATFSLNDEIVCIGPEAMQQNDLVCVLYGADMPFVIRPVSASSYQLIGECYVHSLMHGEAVREVRHKGSRYEEQWIELV